MTIISSVKIQRGYEPVAGYVLEERIGQGGFGEVWRASAPGGMRKAVKFVSGVHDRTRGSRELKSLERIKGVQHPFLLTLERFGIIDDQLVIVTELADGSLEDIYQRHRERGSCGIPRDPLLSYLYDAADALDYLHENYQLQHLDIKPGNLLLVGGHVKVGDFGLLKDLRDVECSVIGGLTPIYAPPEVFDGRPSLHSDQYSLAVMYQELLTGTRPFPGRTIAQLATQHIHNAPNLLPLPPSDRPALARALEKDPERRYPSCREFVESLRTPRGTGSLASTGATIVGEPASGPSGNSLANTPVIRELPQLSPSQAVPNARVTGHTLVVGLGGTGARCLQQLRRRAAKLRSGCPIDLHTLLIDTDVESIQMASADDIADSVRPCQMVHAPLRTAQDYRKLGTGRLRSISRRWIYNVPRSRATEGMRPLGRLALVDAGPEVVQRINQALADLVAACQTGFPKVYVVGSLSGGTGSGVFLDLVHLLRYSLDSIGLEQAEILSLLAGVALRGNPTHPLSLHDTRAALVEIQHFLQPGNGYPGDAGAGWPNVPAARTPLTDTYFIAAGAPGTQHPDPVDTIIEYLWADASGVGDLLRAARSHSAELSEQEKRRASIRSVGAVRLQPARMLEKNLLTPALIRHMLIDWLGLPSSAREVAPLLADRLTRRCRLRADAIMEAELKALGPDERQRAVRLCEFAKRIAPDSGEDLHLMEQRFAHAISESLSVSRARSPVRLQMANLFQALAVRFQDRRVDVTSAIQAVEQLARQARDDCRQLLTPAISPNSSSSDHEAGSAENSSDVYRSTNLDSDDRLQLACECGQRVLRRVASEAAAEQLRELAEQFESLVIQLERMAARIAQAIQFLSSRKGAEENPWDEMSLELRVQFEPTLLELHRQLATAWLSGPLGGSTCSTDPQPMLRAMTQIALPLVKQAVDLCSDDIDPASAIDSETQESSPVDRTRSAIQESSDKQTSVLTLRRREWSDTIALTGSCSQRANGPEEERSLGDALAMVRPPLLECGGQQRLILLVGSETEREQLEPRLRAIHEGALTVSIVEGATPLLIHEAQRIYLDDIIARLDVVCGGDNHVSQKLHSRTDIDWS